MKGYYTFIIHSLINYGANLIVILILALLTNYIKTNLYINFFIVSVIFICYSIYYFLYIYKLEFTPKQL